MTSIGQSKGMFMDKRAEHKRITNEDLYEDIEKIKAALAVASGDVKARAGELFADSIDEMKSNTEDLQDYIAKYTAERPFKSLGIALLVGMALGYIMRK